MRLLLSLGVFLSGAVSLVPQAAYAAKWTANDAFIGPDCSHLQNVIFGSGAGAAAAAASCKFPGWRIEECNPGKSSARTHWCLVSVKWGYGGSAHQNCETGNGNTSKGLCAPTVVNGGCGSAGGGMGGSKSSGIGPNAGNPIEIISGRKHERILDWSGSSASQMRFERFYNSNTDLFTDVSDFALDSRLGQGWRSNFDSSAALDLKSGAMSAAAAVNNDLIHFVMPDHMQYSFKKSSAGWSMVHAVGAALSSATQGSNNWVARTNYNGSLTVSTSGVVFRTAEGTKYAYDNAGVLQSITEPDGYQQKLYYAAGLNTSVIDSHGEEMHFEYETDVVQPAFLKRVLLPDGMAIDFSYESRLLRGGVVVSDFEHNEYALDKVIYPDNTPANATDNPFLSYEYLNNEFFPYALTSIRDENGILHGEWTYDSTGRAVSSQHHNGSDLTTLSYDEVNNKVTVTNALGKQTIYTIATTNQHQRRIISVNGVASSNCLVSDTLYAFNSNGALTQQTDAEGRITTWTRDSRGLPTSRVDGASTADARMTTMSWDPTLPRMAQIVMPGQTIQYGYDSSVDHLVASITATDTTTTTLPYGTNGQSRATTFSYISHVAPLPAAVVSSGAPLSAIALPLVNGNAETGPTTGAITGWNTEQGTLMIKAGQECLTSNRCFSSPTSSGAIVKAYQDIPIPGYSGQVNLGRRSARITWLQRARFDHYGRDASDVQLEFLDQAGAVLNRTGAGYAVKERWTVRGYVVPVPVNTHTIRVRMILYLTGANGISDSYIDDIALNLEANGSASATPLLSVNNPDAMNGLNGWTTTNGTIVAATDQSCLFQNCFRRTGVGADTLSQEVSFPSSTSLNLEIDSAARGIVLGWSASTGLLSAGSEVYGESGPLPSLRFYNASNVLLATVKAAVPEQTLGWNRHESYFDVPAGSRKAQLMFSFDQNWADIAAQGTTPQSPVIHSGLANITLQLVGRRAPAAGRKLLATVDGPFPGTTDITTYGYNADGLVSTITNEMGHVTQVLSHTPAGLPAAIRDANAVDTSLTYNARNWLTSVTANPGASEATTVIEYDAIGQITKITQPDSAFLQYTYNSARRLTSVSNSLSEVVEYDYNLNGDMTSSAVRIVAGGTLTQQMTMVYDELGRLMKSIGASAQETAFFYDRTDLNTQVKDPRNNLYGYSYDALQRLIRTTDQEGSQVNLTRNGQHDVTGYKDPRNFTTTYVRNGFGEVIQEASPDAGTTVYYRDARGLVTQQTDGRGVVTNRSYDAAGRLKVESYPGAAVENVNYTYDSTAGGNEGVGRLTRISDESGTTSFVYDALGRVITNTRVIAGNNYVTRYAYNAAGRVSMITYPSGRQMLVTRNVAGRVTQLRTRVTSAATLTNVASAIAFQPMSDQLKAMTHGNGLVTTAGYDLDGRLTQLQVKNGAALEQGRSFAYADGMNLTGITDQVTATNSNTLGYSPANRLNLAIGPWGTKTHSYDGVGNRITDNTTQGAATTNRTQYYAPTSNRLDNIWQNGTLLQYYNHDGAGNMTSLIRTSETFQYTYNKRNRLASVTRNGALWGTYVYNALEQLVSRTSNAPSAPLGTIHYIYDLDGHLIAEADGATGATLREYLWLPANDNTSGSGNDTLAKAMGLAANDNEAVDLPLAVIDGVGTASPITSFIHTDHLGRPIRMTSATKATVWSATWTPWGEPQSISGTVTNNLRFPGQYFQIETGLHYNWHRHYDPVTGRYTQPDPLRFVDGPSIYAYAGNSPFMNTDREGLDWIDPMGSYYPDGGKSGNYPGFEHNPLENMCSTVIMMAGPAIVAVSGEAATAWVVNAVRAGSMDGFRRFLADESGALRSASVRSAFLRALAKAKGTPRWQKQWLKEGRSPPGHDVDHIVPLSIGGKDSVSNMRLILRADHVIHHRYYRPW